MMRAPADDPRRQGPIEVVFESEGIGELRVDSIRWGAVEWSDKRAGISRFVCAEGEP